jgi:2-dehydro-3-deoxyphosphogluconate aldolase/(4S)-4-hydroxy-2-oxoglutarate aldolase
MKRDLMEELKRTRVIAILRLGERMPLADTVAALVEGGIRFIEVTMTMPDALAGVAECAERFGSRATVGAGTVLDAATARAVVGAGARFVVSPVTDETVIRTCGELGAAVMPGAQTPTEVYRAWRLGADAVKVFSARAGGPAYLRDLKGPFPDIELLPTGGVDSETAAAYLAAGACAVGIGGALAPAALVAGGRFDEIAAGAARLLERLGGAPGGAA